MDIGKTTFTANGTLKTSINTITNTKIQTVYRQQTIYQVTYNYIDPVAQTFTVEEDQILNSISLYFSQREQSHNIIVQIRETDNAYPNNTVLGEKVLSYDEVNISTDGLAETKVTFDDPVYLRKGQQYAFTVMTTSTKASLWIEELGKKDIATRQQVTQNPYIPGVMFTSSNALTWTAHQTKNIKFRLFTNDFITSSTVTFNNITGVNYDSVLLLADTVVPIDTSLTWEYSVDGNQWLPITLSRVLPMLSTIDTISLRANIKAKRNVSPTIAIDSLLLVGIKNLEKSSYVTRNITLDAPFTEVKIVADVDAPSGTNVGFYVATDVDGVKWKALQQQDNPVVKVVDGYIEYTYKTTVDSAKNIRAKVDMTTNDSTIVPKVRRLKVIMK